MRRSTIALLAIASGVVLVAVLLRSFQGEPVAGPITTLTPVDPTTSTTMTIRPSTTTTLPSGVEVCDLYGEIAVAGAIVSSELVEASGLAVSRTRPDVLWSHNDSRGSATLHAFTERGDDLGVFGVPGALALDWEDMAAGPGPDGEGSYLYVGDIGDNFDIRGGIVTVYRIPDSDPAQMGTEFTESVPLSYRYPDGSHNAEALFVDPIEPALYIVTKARDEALVYKGSLEPTAGPGDLTLVASLAPGDEVSGADMSADGATLALRGYQTVWMWHRNNGVLIDDMLDAAPCTAPAPDERQGEAIAFDADTTYWTLSEGANADLHLVRRAGT